MMEEIVKVVSETHLSKVLIVKKASNRIVIWKEVYDTRIFDAEVKALKILKNRTDIVQYYKKVRVGPSKFIEMEYINGKTLEEVILNGGLMSEEDGKEIFRQIAFAVMYCHQNGVFHRDIKLGNVMVLDDPEKKTKNSLIKLIDFGVCGFGDRDTIFTKARGTREYVAPEMIVKKPYHASETDIYSLGMVLYEILTATIPIPLGERIAAMLEREEQPPIVFPEKFNLSNEVQDLITRMLSLNPSERPTIEEVISHPWLGIANAKEITALPTKKKGFFESWFGRSSKGSDSC